MTKSVLSFPSALRLDDANISARFFAPGNNSDGHGCWVGWIFPIASPVRGFRRENPPSWIPQLDAFSCLFRVP